jgi:hypothetical protein
MKQIFVDGVYDYDYSEEVIEEGVIHVLFYSNAEHWSEHVRGKELLSITDDDNGFKFNHSRPKKRMDYHEAFYLSVLLKIISFNDHKVEISGEKVLL